ncbi:pentatricopeptide repeat-containing protein 1, mitochondrial [Neodiprion virginianus]|uniref:pentatricopeptide repeat-containing protein 1, mitochondrial n=1 Tax=Neodiprion virginianus TaxID=2961670 RepID=UPI001EE6F8B5|nr:pentatricopeptide repeat-containing protein 1, mitochondrial [Neodiprion virginianus]
MLTTKLNLAFSTGTVNNARLSILAGKLDLNLLEKKSYSCVSQTFIHNSQFISNKRFGESLSKYTSGTTPNNLSGTSKAGQALLHRVVSRTFASENLQENADIFGDLGDRRYEKVELDRGDKKEEEFIQNEAKPPPRSVLTPGKYADLIKQHIALGDLDSAANVLDQVKDDRNKPTNYMYNLLIRAFAMRGNVKKCFSLYNNMKKQELKPTLATYVSLLNSCANCMNSELALEKLIHLRQIMIEKGIEINPVHYNAMLKAYGRHGKLLEAFQLVDEMCDKKMTIGISTCNFLLQASISDKEAGFRHALIVWHLVRHRKLKPDIYTYNLLLRSARDCKLGNLKAEDLIAFPEIKKNEAAMITYADRTNLLAHPPQVGQQLPLIDASNNTDLVADSETKLTSKSAISKTSDPLPLANIQSSSSQMNFLLLGGIANFISQMENDKVKPDIKTTTYLMELVPGSELAEKTVINYAKSAGVELDVDFYNLLIRKRSFRFDYQNALKVLSMLEQDNLEPNIMTWGVLALTCTTPSQARELFEGMELSGHRLNAQIIGAILRQAAQRLQFSLIIELMQKMQSEKIIPSPKIYEILDLLNKKAAKMFRAKDDDNNVNKSLKYGYQNFKRVYPQWLKEMKVASSDRKKKVFDFTSH